MFKRALACCYRLIAKDCHSAKLSYSNCVQVHNFKQPTCVCVRQMRKNHNSQNA